MRSPKINPFSKFLHVEFSAIRQLLSADNQLINMQIEQVRMLFLVVQAAKNVLVEKASSYGMNVRVLLPNHRYASNLESGLLSQVRGAGNVTSEASSRAIVNMPKQYYGTFGSRPASNIERALSVVSSRSSELLKQSEQLTTFEKLCTSANNIIRTPVIVGAAAMAKSPLPKPNYEFKGGDNLEGIHAHYHRILMINELEGGKKAYEFKWAKTDKSGPSFGGNQMDIAYSAVGRECLLGIVKNARDTNGQLLFSESEFKAIEQILKQPQNMVGKNAEKVFDNPAKMKKAMSSEFGRQMIDNVYLFEIHSRAQKIEGIVTSLKNGPGKNFAQSTEGKLYIFDYDNQYDIGSDSPLVRYLNGEEITLKSGEIIPRFTKGKFTGEDFFDFLTHLKYYKNHPRDVERRYKNIKEHVEKYVEEELYAGGGEVATEGECFKLLNIDWYHDDQDRSRRQKELRYVSFAENLAKKYSDRDIVSKCEELYGAEAYGFSPESKQEPEPEQKESSRWWGW
ncbi:MAG: hypothetical protein K0R73_776 [Candidatus Midichloriaceae bacterium]|jgi:hypothetical protein|nr:hypothetical protein [Candidatus Midichloriaceae bacterium]